MNESTAVYDTGVRHLSVVCMIPVCELCVVNRNRATEVIFYGTSISK
jgi:hypothetical protein